jgi:hypothetical protein
LEQLKSADAQSIRHSNLKASIADSTSAFDILILVPNDLLGSQKTPSCSRSDVDFDMETCGCGHGNQCIKRK